MKVPISADGGIQHFPDRGWVENPEHQPGQWPVGDIRSRYSIPGEVDWQEVDVMLLRLQLEGIHRNGHQAYFWWKGIQTGATYPMFMSDIVDLLQRAQVFRGRILADFIPSKRGDYYGIKLAK